MSVFTRADFRDWKNHPITQELLNTLVQSSENFANEMVGRSYPDVNKDQWIRGACATIGYALAWEPSLIEPLAGFEDEVEDEA